MAGGGQPSGARCFHGRPQAPDARNPGAQQQGSRYTHACVSGGAFTRMLYVLCDTDAPSSNGLDARSSPTPQPPKRLRQTVLSFAPAPSGVASLNLQPSKTPSSSTAALLQGTLWGPPPSAQTRRALLLASEDTLRGKAARIGAGGRPSSGQSGRAGGPGGAGGPSQTRASPKRIPFEDMPPWQAVLRAPRMVVDRFGIDYVYCGAAHWFLTHFHADHYKGLSKHFDGGTRMQCPRLPHRRMACANPSHVGACTASIVESVDQC